MLCLGWWYLDLAVVLSASLSVDKAGQLGSHHSCLTMCAMLVGISAPHRLHALDVGLDKHLFWIPGRLACLASLIPTEPLLYCVQHLPMHCLLVGTSAPYMYGLNASQLE